MYNLKKHAQSNKEDRIGLELGAFDIIKNPDTSYSCKVGDETLHLTSINECLDQIVSGVAELKEHIWEDWQDLANLATIILQNESGNEGGLNNLMFLNAVKKSYLISKVFSDLSDVSKILEQLFDMDAINVNNELIVKFNSKYLRIRLLHCLIMREIYRVKLIRHSFRNTRSAQVSGPWANLDLPMKERVWEWSEDEEYFDTRTKAKREQTRYNPETNSQGFYYVWQDLTRDPYLFEDMQKDSPYKSRHLLTIP